MSRYAEIAAHYREAIRNGDLSPGDPFPSYTDAGKAHKVNRTTIVRAYDLLKSEGLIKALPGKGTVVAPSSLVITGIDRVERMRRNGRQYAPGENSSEHHVSRQPLHDVKVCEALDLAPGDEVVIRIRTFRQDGRPTSIGISTYPQRTVEHVPELTQEGRMTPSFFGGIYTERTGLEVSEGPRKASCRQATPEELAALEVDVPSYASVSVMITNVTFHDEAGPLGHWKDIYAPGAELDIPKG